MNRRQSIPEPVIVALSSGVQPTLPATDASNQPTDRRQQRIDEFLQARSLAPQSQKAYRQDLQRFLQWTDQDWATITPHHITRFKATLMQSDPISGQRHLSDATVRRVLGTLKTFYTWMARSHYISTNPTSQIDLPKLADPEAQSLNDTEVAQIYQAVAASSLSERNIALISVLLHGLRVEEISILNLEDYDGQRLRIQGTRTGKQGCVPLTPEAQADLNRYLQWRQAIAEPLSPTSPLFISHSRRNPGQRLSYDGIRKVIDQLAKQTGINVHAYQFRHTFATNLIQKGMNPHHVMTLTRHRSIQTFHRYTKTADHSATEAAFNDITHTPSPHPQLQ